MARIIILLLPLFTTFSAADDYEGSRYNIHYPCGQPVCFHIWKPEDDEIAIVRNGQICTTPSEVEEFQCSVTVNPLTDASPHHCKRNVIYSPFGQIVSLQCVLLTSLDSLSCLTSSNDMLSVMWVDENGDPVQKNSEYHITQNSPCDVTVASPNRRNATFQCVARVNDQVWTSGTVQIRQSALRGKGRGVVIDNPQPEEKGAEGGVQNNQVVGPTVGVLGAVVVMAAAVYVVNRRRTNIRPATESPTSTADSVLDSDEVIYADVVFSAASGRVCVSEYEPTEYATVCYT